MSGGVFDEDKTVGDGGGGGVFASLDMFGGAESNTKLVAGGEAMLDSAKAGGFRVSEEGVDQLLKDIRQARDKLSELGFESQYLGQEPKLGGHVYGRTLAAHDRQSAIGDRGVLPMLSAFRETLEMVEEAVLRAAGRYREAEDDARAAWKSH